MMEAIVHGYYISGSLRLYGHYDLQKVPRVVNDLAVERTVADADTAIAEEAAYEHVYHERGVAFVSVPDSSKRGEHIQQCTIETDNRILLALQMILYLRMM